MQTTTKTVTDLQNDAVAKILTDKQETVTCYIKTKLNRIEATNAEIAKLQQKITDANTALAALSAMTVEDAYAEVEKKNQEAMSCSGTNQWVVSYGYGSTTL